MVKAPTTVAFWCGVRRTRAMPVLRTRSQLAEPLILWESSWYAARTSRDINPQPTLFRFDSVFSADEKHQRVLTPSVVAPQ